MTFIFVYLLFLIFSISFIDADTPLDNRILSAIVMPLIVVFSVVASSLASIQPRVLIRIFAFLVLLFILFRHGRTVFHDVRRRQSAEDLAWFCSLQSDTLDALHEIPQSAAVWSDKTYAIFMAYRIRTDRLPLRPVNPLATAQSAEEYAKSIQSFRDQLNNAGGGRVVFWHQLLDFGYGNLSEDDVRKNFVISEEDKYKDGVLLRIDDPHAKPSTATSVPKMQISK